MHIDRVRHLLERARSQRILVAGDLMLDEYVWGEVTRISPEAPVPVVRVSGESWYPGGAANVARNVRSFADWTGVLGVAGPDEGGRRLRTALEEAGVDVAGLIEDPGHATIVKTRIVAKHQQVVRVDRERIPEPSARLDASAVAAIDKLVPEVDGVIISDYAKGFVNQPLVDRIRAAAAEHGKIAVTADPSPLNPVDWTGVTAVKPNRIEALRAAGLHELSNHLPEDMVRVGEQLLDTWGARMILLTLGEEGMLLFERGRPLFRTPTRSREVYDVSGAGDTAIAVFTLALCAGATPPEAAELANAASGIVVGKLGTASASPAELIADFEAAR